jgi:hypothetical protein
MAHWLYEVEVQDDVTKCRGLVTQENPLHTQPGALTRADNVVVNRNDIFENRRGYATYMSLSNEPTQILAYRDRIIVHNGTALTYDSDGAGTPANYSGSYTAPTGRKMRGEKAKANLYVTTNAGVKVAQDITGTALRSAGVPTSLDPQSAFNHVTTGNTHSNTAVDSIASANPIVVGMTIAGSGIPGGTTVTAVNGTTITISAAATTTVTTNSLTFAFASGFLANTKGTAYRSVIKQTDLNGNIMQGAPSPRLFVSNGTGTDSNVVITQIIPSEITTSTASQYVLQFYRTTSTTAGASDAAGDEMALVYQQTLAAADVTAGSIVFSDITADSLRGAALYTNATQEGFSQANNRPPQCKDVALYRNNYMFYANTSTRMRLNFTIVGTSNLYNGGSYGRTVIIAGTTYTSAAAENTATGAFKAFSTGVAATDIDNTARSLVKVINRYATNTTVYAYYLSGYTDLPGQILIEERSIGGAAYSITVGTAASANDFFPKPPTSIPSSGDSLSSNEVRTNRIYYSKTQQPEGVPLTNFLDIGPSNTEILRCIALRDSLMLIKQEGIYRLTGETPQSFSVVPLDLTVFCKAPDSAAALNNRIHMVSNQGVVAVGDTGVQVLSRVIEPDIIPLVGQTNLSTTTYGVAYESDHEYRLSTLDTGNPSTPTQIFVYNYFANAWTRWTFEFSCGIVEPTADKFYFAIPGVNKIYRERKAFSSSDYSDPESAITIVSISGMSVNFTISGATPDSGWQISQNGSTNKISTVSQNVDLSWTAVMANTIPSAWTAGAATIYPSIVADVEWSSWFAGQTGVMKQVREVKILTDSLHAADTISSLIATFRTDLDASRESVELSSNAFGWGSMFWGSSPWGGRAETFNYRTFVPQRKQYCRIMTAGVKHQNANEHFSCGGITYTFEMISERTTK